MKLHMGLVVLVKKCQPSLIFYCKIPIFCVSPSQNLPKFCWSCLTGLTNFVKSVMFGGKLQNRLPVDCLHVFRQNGRNFYSINLEIYNDLNDDAFVTGGLKYLCRLSLSVSDKFVGLLLTRFSDRKILIVSCLFSDCYDMTLRTGIFFVSL